MHPKLPMALIVFGIAFSARESACQHPSTRGQISGDWLIPKKEIYDGGPSKDGIAALTNPLFLSANEASYLTESDLVIGVKIKDEIRAYPHFILDWHEVINDDINGTLFAVTYCPLTGSAVAWGRVVGSETTTFGVSGLLYNSNLIPYDRATNSHWSQMRLQCVNGERKGEFAVIHPIIETNWKTWRTMYPGTKVISHQTGYSRPYGFYPYGDYRTSNDLLFPVSNRDSRLSPKERILSVFIGEKTRAYRINSFVDSINLLNDSLNNVPIVVAGSRRYNFAAALERRLQDGTVLSFSPLQSSLPLLMTDREGTKWDVWGKAVEGPRAGLELKSIRSYISYWFALASFYPHAEIHLN